MKDETNHALGILDWIYYKLTPYAECWTPEKCSLCGTERKGNWFIGYYLPCMKDPNHY